MRTGLERYTYIWIEGYDQLREFCLQRFKQPPYLCEHSGHCGEAHIRLRYKEDNAGEYHEMYLLTMEHPRGEFASWWELHTTVERAWNYEQIRADRRSILRPRGRGLN